MKQPIKIICTCGQEFQTAKWASAWSQQYQHYLLSLPRTDDPSREQYVRDHQIKQAYGPI